MGIIDSTTGHNPRKERTIAIELYVALVIAVILGGILFFALGNKFSLNPAKQGMSFERAAPTPPLPPEPR